MEAPSDYLSTHKKVKLSIKTTSTSLKEKRRIRSKLREKGEINLNKRSEDTQKFLAIMIRSERRGVAGQVGKWGRWGIKWLIIRGFLFFNVVLQCIYCRSFLFRGSLLLGFGNLCAISLFHELWYRGKGLSDMLVLLANCQF